MNRIHKYVIAGWVFLGFSLGSINNGSNLARNLEAGTVKEKRQYKELTGRIDSAIMQTQRSFEENRTDYLNIEEDITELMQTYTFDIFNQYLSEPFL